MKRPFVALILMLGGCTGDERWHVEVDGELTTEEGSGAFRGSDTEDRDGEGVWVANEEGAIGGEELGLDFRDDTQQRMPDLPVGVPLFAGVLGLDGVEGWASAVVVSDLVNGTFTATEVSEDRVAGTLSATFGADPNESYPLDLEFRQSAFEGTVVLSGFGAQDPPADYGRGESCWYSGGAGADVAAFYGDEELDLACAQAWLADCVGPDVEVEVSYEEACAQVQSLEGGWAGPGACPYC